MTTTVAYLGQEVETQIEALEITLAGNDPGGKDYLDKVGPTADSPDDSRVAGPGDLTRLNVTYYNINKPHGELSAFEQFTLQRRRSDR